MKYLPYGFLLAGFIGFGCNNNSSTSSKYPSDTAGNHNGVMTDTPVGNGSGSSSTTPGSETVLWVGKPARYIKHPDDILDGKYDSVEHIFIACGSKLPEKVDNASMIAYDDVSNCDTSFTNTIRYIIRPVNGLPMQISPVIVVQTPSQVVAHEPVMVTDGKQTMTVRAADMERIRAAAQIHLNRVNQRQMLVPMHH